jgi:cyclic di-GMP phosphodiesterase
MHDNDWVSDVTVTEDAGVKNAPNVLVAGESDTAAALTDLLGREGFEVTRVHDGRAALDHVKQRPVDAALLDQDLAGLDGTEVCRLVKRDQNTRLVPVILLLPDQGSREERVEGIEAGVDQLVSMPVDIRELSARVRSLARLKRYTDDFEPAAAVMTTLSAMIEARARYSEGHCHRMANYAASLGRRIGLMGEDIHTLRRGGFLHDIGMLAVPDAVLLKPASLDDGERALARTHPVIGESLISNLRSLQAVRAIVRHHHERRDGSGYPDGLRGDEIPLSAQIVGLVDVFEALTSRRPYQKTKSATEALVTLRGEARRGWHREDLLDEFADIVGATERRVPHHES